MRHIHVVGSGPRTGTTLMAEAMKACFRIDASADHEARIFSRPSRPAGVYLTKAPQDILVAKPYLEANRDLYVVCMIRDPRDAVVSRHGKAPDRYWAGLRYWNTYIPRWRRARAHPRFITVHYEDLVTRPDDVQDRLAGRLGFLEPTAPFRDYHVHARPGVKSVRALNSVRPISPDGIGAWRRHRARLAGQLLIHGSIADDLIEFGYETDDSWLSKLDGVAPDLSPSHWPEFFTRREMARRLVPAYLRIPSSWLRGRIGAEHAGGRR